MLLALVNTICELHTIYYYTSSYFRNNTATKDETWHYPRTKPFSEKVFILHILIQEMISNAFWKNFKD